CMRYGSSYWYFDVW
nr:immunoglobulin heavy chain junction region [Mus musculus]NSM06120.1 immunoglobulin heavy chain junction region [Mus musculus]NSM06724.1 immunoglobulin heavy chain junction region [Mus musculus]